MMHRDSETFMNKLLGLSADDSIQKSEKEPYAVPVLSVVKFMFENDITFGSFSNNPGEDDNDADNSTELPPNWWN